MVNYACQKGLDDTYSYTNLSDGDRGNVYINSFTGAMIYEHDLIETVGGDFPIDIDLIYSSFMGAKELSGQGYINTSMFGGISTGKGWKLSCQECITPISVLEIDLEDQPNRYDYIYTDRDGSERYFYFDSQDEEHTTYICEDDPDIILTSSAESFEMTFGDGSSKTFKDDI